MNDGITIHFEDGIHADQIEHDDAAGPTRPPDVLTVQAGIQFKSYHANCGLPNVCPSRHFSIYLHTGISNTIHPQLCVDGKL